MFEGREEINDSSNCAGLSDEIWDELEEEYTLVFE